MRDPEATQANDPGPSPLFGKDNLPADGDPDNGGHRWQEFQKVETTKAMRIEGPFRVITIHGGDPQVCEDGYLAVDNQGHPYPIAREVIEAGFRPVDGPPPAEAGGDLDLEALVERLSTVSDRERGQLLELASPTGAGLAGQLTADSKRRLEDRGLTDSQIRATLTLLAVGLVDQAWLRENQVERPDIDQTDAAGLT